MIKVIIFFSLVCTSVFGSFFVDSSRYVYDDYNNNIKIIWMQSKKEVKKSKLQKKFGKALNASIKNAISKRFKNKTLVQKPYANITSIMEDPSIYSDKQKLFDAVFDLFDPKLQDQYVVALKLNHTDGVYRVYGLKLFKDGSKSLVSTFEVDKKADTISTKELTNMINFFILSSMYDYDTIKRTGANSIIQYKDATNTSLIIETFKSLPARKFLDYVSQKDLELAYKNHLVSTDKVTPNSAQQFCSIMGMMLINKNFIESDKDPEDEYYYEMLFEKFSFKDGWEVYQRKSFLNPDDKQFRCVDSRDSKLIKSMKEYETTEIGLRYRINKDAKIYTDKIVASDIESETSADDEDILYIVIVDENGLISLWQTDEENDTMELVAKHTISVNNLNNIKGIDLSASIDKITLETLTDKISWDIADGELINESKTSIKTYIKDNGHHIIKSKEMPLAGTISVDMEQNILINSKKYPLPYWPTAFDLSSKNVLVIGGDSILESYQLVNGLQLSKTPIKYKGINSEIEKILFFNEGEYFVVGTINSELLFYKTGNPQPIKIISKFGYSIVDMSISKNGKYLIAVNGDLIVYVYELDTILNSTIEDK